MKRNLEREKVILRLLAQGWGPSRVGRHFGISASRVTYIKERAFWEMGHRALWDPSISFPPLTVREG